MEKRKTPRIRFKGFSDDWEQRKLGKLVAFSKGAGYSKGDLKENGTPIILYGRLYTKYETVISDVDTFADAKENSVYSKGGEVIVPASGETTEDISIASVVEKSGVLLGGDLNVITPANGIDSAFLAISISNGKPHNDMAKMAQGKSVVHLHNLDLAKIDFPYPSYKEQQKIRKYFSNLDHLITLHQRKLNILKSAPKFLLGIVWEQRKLGDIVTRVVRKNENLESKLPLTISAQFGLIAQDEFFDKRIASKNISHYYLIRKGEFAYNKSTSMDAPWGAIKRLEHYDNGVLSTLYIMFRILDENKVNSDYIVSYYVTNLWHKGVREVAAEGARNHGLLNIAPVDFFETTLTIPSNENEQKNIGEYFRRLDRLITLHQRQQNLWKFVRKGVKLWIILTKNQILKRP